MRWEAWRRKNREIVMRRCNYGAVCEGCGGRMRPLELAHLAGRNNKGVGEPWASTAALTAGLCSSGYGVVGCHNKIDQALDANLLRFLRWKAVERLRDDYGFATLAEDSIDPLDAIRESIRRLEADGWEWSGTELVKVGEVVSL